MSYGVRFWVIRLAALAMGWWAVAGWVFAAEGPVGTAAKTAAGSAAPAATSPAADSAAPAAVASAAACPPWWPARVTPGLGPTNIVIIVNDNMPESVALGNYYAEQRCVPLDNICHIKTVCTEVVSREAYDREIAQPVREFLERRLGQMRVQLPEGELRMLLEPREVRCLVTVYGVPLKIDGFIDTKEMFKSMAAGVDSELALLPRKGHLLNGARPNLYFNQDQPFDSFLARYMLLVCRLDGPSPEVVRRMIDDAVAAEAAGLQGRGYFDLRGIKSGGYAEGDLWIRNAYLDCKRAGLAVTLDEEPETFPVEYQMSEAAFYLGWYSDRVSGPFSRPDFKFQRGAVAYHLHSFSAWKIRSPQERWAGPLLAHGAAVTMGAVYEPFLNGTPYLDLFTNRLLQGYTFAEAAYMSQRQLSWMAVFLGDPLYRPFLNPIRPPTGPEPARLKVKKGGE